MKLGTTRYGHLEKRHDADWKQPLKSDRPENSDQAGDSDDLARIPQKSSNAIRITLSVLPTEFNSPPLKRHPSGQSLMG